MRCPRRRVRVSQAGQKVCGDGTVAGVRRSGDELAEREHQVAKVYQRESLASRRRTSSP